MPDMTSESPTFREALLQAILDKQAELKHVETELASARADVAKLRKDRNALSAELMKIISHGPDAQQLLPLGDGMADSVADELTAAHYIKPYAAPSQPHSVDGASDSAGDLSSLPKDEAPSVETGASPAGTAAADVPAVTADDWRLRPVTVLGFSDETCDAAVAGIATLGDLNKLWASGKSVAGLPNFNRERAIKFNGQWRAYEKNHPEVNA